MREWQWQNLKSEIIVPLSSQEKSQPDGVCVKECWHYFVHDVENVACSRWVDDIPMVPKGVQVKVPGRGREQGEEISDCHGQQDKVRRRAHVWLPEDYDNQQIGHQREEKKKGQYVAK